MHGIVRGVTGSGRIFEASYKVDKRHGLLLWFDINHVIVELYCEGERLSGFSFNMNFEEDEGPLKRRGNDLDHLSPQHFDPSVANP